MRLPPSSLLDPLGDAATLTTPESGTGTSTQIIAPPEADQPTPSAPLPETTETTAAPSEGAPPAPAVQDQSEEPIYAPPPVNAAPQVVNFQGVEVVGGLWRFTGDVIDEAPGGLTIYFGGEPDSLQDQTTRTAANGHFDVAFLVNTDGSDDGLASARTVDGAGLASNVALYNIHPS